MTNTQQPARLRRRWCIAIWLSALVLILAVASWFGYMNFVSPQPPGDSEMVSTAFTRRYDSIDRLAAVSDAVVVGEVTGVVSTQPDKGDSGLAEPIPSTWYEVEVQETLKGEAADKITVVRYDPGTFRDTQITVLLPGEQVALFLAKRTAEEFPVVTMTDIFYIPISFDNGVFDVEPSPSDSIGETAIRPRISDLFDVDTFTLEEVRRVVGRS